MGYIDELPKDKWLLRFLTFVFLLSLFFSGFGLGVIWAQMFSGSNFQTGLEWMYKHTVLIRNGIGGDK